MQRRRSPQAPQPFDKHELWLKVQPSAAMTTADGDKDYRKRGLNATIGAIFYHQFVTEPLSATRDRSLVALLSSRGGTPEGIRPSNPEMDVLSPDGRSQPPGPDQRAARSGAGMAATQVRSGANVG
jgi:hypothetical protein